MLAQFGIRQRMGAWGVALVTLAGIAPDLDSALKLRADQEFWRLHHVLGHNVFAITVLAMAIAGAGYVFGHLRPVGLLFLWCFVAGCVHDLTDSLYWWGVQPFWPFSRIDVCCHILEYLDVIVLVLWLTGAFCLYRFPTAGVRIAVWTLSLFASYVAVRALLPPPTGLLKLITGGWMYAAPQGTPVLDWW